MDALAEIKHLYYNATKTTIQKDLARAVALLKAMPTEEDRERAGRLYGWSIADAI
jgi:hypothetical protein